MWNPISNTEILAYTEFCNLQKKYTEKYIDLELKYLECGCIKCKLLLISFGLELGSLNTIVSHLEQKLAPGTVEILDCMRIPFRIIDDHIYL